MWGWLQAGSVRWPWITVLTWGVAELVLRLRLTLRVGLRGRARQWVPAMRARLREWTFLVLVGAIGAAVICALTLARAGWAATGGGVAVIVAGELLALTGLALRIWSILTLGRFFTFAISIADDHRVVQDGPYRFLRHPSYSGVLLILLGVGVCMRNWLSLVTIVTIPALAFAVRITAEEAALDAALGADYRAYAERTSRLIPGVW